MQPLLIVVVCDELLQVRRQILKVAVLLAVDLLLLQGLHEAFTDGVVIGIRRPAHARDHVLELELLDIIGAGILDPLVGMMNYPGGGCR